MSHSTSQKRKAQALLDGSLGQKSSLKRHRTSERSEDSDDNDIDEYIPGSAKTTKGVSTSGSRGKTTNQKLRSTKGTKMSVDEGDTSHATTPISDAVNRKGPHGRPLSREQLRKANHSLIERRRREKMNKAFADLRSMVPGLSADSDGLKGEFKLEVSVEVVKSSSSLTLYQVLERSVEHMRHLTESLSALKSGTSTAAQTPSHVGSILRSDLSSPDNLMASGYAIPAKSGTKRKIGIAGDHAEQSHRTSRQSSVQSRSSDERSPVDGKFAESHERYPLILAPQLRSSAANQDEGGLPDSPRPSCQLRDYCWDRCHLKGTPIWLHRSAVAHEVVDTYPGIQHARPSRVPTRKQHSRKKAYRPTTLSIRRSSLAPPSLSMPSPQGYSMFSLIPLHRHSVIFLRHSSVQPIRGQSMQPLEKTHRRSRISPEVIP